MDLILDYWNRYAGFVNGSLMRYTRFLCDHLPFPAALAGAVLLPMVIMYSLPVWLMKVLAIMIIAPFIWFLGIALSAMLDARRP